MWLFSESWILNKRKLKIIIKVYFATDISQILLNLLSLKIKLNFLRLILLPKNFLLEY